MTTRRRLAALTGAAVLTSGLATGVAVAAPGTADATVCTGSVPVPCAIGGTVTLTGGVLNMITSTALAWTGVVTGAAQSLVDATTTDTGYEVSDLTGASGGWKVSASATTFTSLTAPTGTASTFPDAGTLVNVGSTSSVSATTAPSAVCLVAGTCTLPSSPSGEPTYPLAITTAATSPTPVVLYHAAAGTGVGLIEIGTNGILGTVPSAWWVNVPANAGATAYTSTITMTIASGP